WVRASEWIDGQHFAGTLGQVGLMGVPIRKGSITEGRCDLAPAAIRAALAKLSTFDVNRNVDLRELTVRNFGDLNVAEIDPANALSTISDAVQNALANVLALVVLGGNNSITRPCFHGLASQASLERTGLLTLDAHLDLRDLTQGLTNGNPVRALL